MSKALVYSIYMYTVERSSQQKQMDLVNSLAAFLAEAVIPLQPQKAKSLVSHIGSSDPLCLAP